MNELTVLPPSRPPVLAQVDLVDAFLSGRAAATLRSYSKDIEDFASFLGQASSREAAAMLVSLPHGEANAVALGYKSHMMERGLAPSTINRRLAAVRSLVKLARTLGFISWSLDVEGVRHEPYRDTRGPGREGFVKLVDALEGRLDAKAKRDRAIVRLLFDLALRREEVVRLDLVDVNLVEGFLLVTGKGKSEPFRLTLPNETKDALAAWTEARGHQPGPLFTSFDRAGKGTGRLTGTAVYQIIRGLGLQAGIKARPHGLRHASITLALDLLQGDVRSVQRFSRHADLRTLNRYDDARVDMAGEIAKRVAKGA